MALVPNSVLFLRAPHCSSVAVRHVCSFARLRTGSPRFATIQAIITMCRFSEKPIG